MSNYFNGINIGYKALQVQKKSLDITGHNIANANNEGYTRQRAIHNATTPHPMPGLYTPTGAGQMGTGVEISEIERIKDEFIESQIREESQEQGYWEKRSEGMNRIEMIFNEPSDSSLNSAIGNFWQSLQDLSNQPEDPATRATVRQRGMVLVDSFHTLYDQLNDYQRALNSDVESTVSNINSLTRRIADLNKQIVGIKGTGNVPNDLLDERDVLFTELNKKIDVQGKIDDRGNLHVSAGGISLVAGVEVQELTVQADTSSNKYQDKVVFKNSGEELDLRSGELAGIIYIRDTELENYKNKLDNLAQGFLDRFNKVHSYGYDLNGNQGNNFFAIDENFIHAADGIDLSEDIKTDLDKIASGNYSDRPDVVVVENESALADTKYKIEVNNGNEKRFDYIIYDDDDNILYTGSVNEDEIIEKEGLKIHIQSTGTANISLYGNQGSGTNAIALADSIKKDQVVDGSSIADYYESVISIMGVDTQRANKMVNNQKALVSQLKNQQSSISGVSLDEEMANIIRYQQAYNAAAKIITNTDRLLETLMNSIR